MTSREMQLDISGKACVITGDLLHTQNAKTAHGLIRQSDRFDIIGVIDTYSSGQDAGELLDGQHRNIPVCDSLDTLIDAVGYCPEYAIIGMATSGGMLPESLYPLVHQALSLGISIINGLHESIADIASLAEVSDANPDTHIYDIRKPQPTKELHFWSGKIEEVKALKVAVLGTDCGLGKRTTSRFLVNQLIEDDYNAHMIYTGQTGWLQGGQYGFILDSTLNDFISGELEHAVCECWENENPDVIVLEGQSALRNPSGPCGSEYIISCALDGVVLHHDPKRKYFKGWEEQRKLIPSLTEEIELIQLLGTKTIAITLNTASLNRSEAAKVQKQLEKETGIPVILPLYEGMGKCAAVIQNMIQKNA